MYIYHRQLLQHSSEEIDNIDYRFEAARFQSFENCHIPYIGPKKFAAVGFYYRSEGDKVTCFECQAKIWYWIEGLYPQI